MHRLLASQTSELNLSDMIVAISCLWPHAEIAATLANGCSGKGRSRFLLEWRLSDALFLDIVKSGSFISVTELGNDRCPWVFIICPVDMLTVLLYI